MPQPAANQANFYSVLLESDSSEENAAVRTVSVIEYGAVFHVYKVLNGLVATPKRFLIARADALELPHIFHKAIYDDFIVKYSDTATRNAFWSWFAGYRKSTIDAIRKHIGRLHHALSYIRDNLPANV